MYLRDKCPCATCSGAHGTPPRQPEADNPFQMYKPALKMLGVEPVGNYAIRINWSDGHNTRHLLLRALPPDLPVRGVQVRREKSTPLQNKKAVRFRTALFF